MKYWNFIILFNFLIFRPTSSLFEDAFDKLGSFGVILDNIVNLPIGLSKFAAESIEFNKKETIDKDIKNGSEYDFIIVGAGSAGSVIASRLSEIANITVLLLEAGNKEYLFYDIPGAALLLQDLPINWADLTEPSDDYCNAFENNQCQWAHGKVMGGSSTINFQLASRGTPDDYDNWASLGNEGWAFKDVIKYFNKVENYTANQPGSISKLRGHSGPIPVQFARFHTSISTSFINAGLEMGFPNQDYNSKGQISFARWQVNNDNGERITANRGYLHPARNRKNLSVSRKSFAEKILINEDTKRAYGIQFKKGGDKITVTAKKEVILCAGAINSPHLLMLSGIGPKEHLEEMKINVVKDAPGVGENLMDHVGTNGILFTTNATDMAKIPYWLRPWDPTLNDYFSHRTGYLAFQQTDAVGFIDVNNLTARGGRSNIELLLGSISFFGDGAKLDLTRKMYKHFAFGNFAYGNSFQIFPILLQPESRGKLSLKSNKPEDRPKLVANYLATEYDVERLIKAIRFIIELTKTKAFQEINATLYDKPMIGCERFAFDSDDYWECHMRTYPFTYWHYTGTAKMGPKTDPMAVVDSRLRVYGIEGLRVADTSIYPMISRCHTNFPTMMIGEKTSDMIKEDWDLPIE